VADLPWGERGKGPSKIRRLGPTTEKIKRMKRKGRTGKRRKKRKKRGGKKNSKCEVL